MDWPDTTARREEEHQVLGFGVTYNGGLTVGMFSASILWLRFIAFRSLFQAGIRSFNTVLIGVCRKLMRTNELLWCYISDRLSFKTSVNYLVICYTGLQSYELLSHFVWHQFTYCISVVLLNGEWIYKMVMSNTIALFVKWHVVPLPVHLYVFMQILSCTHCYFCIYSMSDG